MSSMSSMSLSIYLTVCLSIYLSTCLSVCLCHLSISMYSRFQHSAVDYKVDIDVDDSDIDSYEYYGVLDCFGSMPLEIKHGKGMQGIIG